MSASHPVQPVVQSFGLLVARLLVAFWYGTVRCGMVRYGTVGNDSATGNDTKSMYIILRSLILYLSLILYNIAISYLIKLAISWSGQKLIPSDACSTERAADTRDMKKEYHSVTLY